MNLQGTITSIVPDGGYQGTNGYVYTFQMTIQTADGPHTGQIGSKSQVYPIAVGAPISVTVTTTQHGVRFKKYNPDYAQQDSQQGQPQGNGEKETRIKRGNSLNAIFSATEIPSDMVGEYLLAGVQFIETGRWNLRLPISRTQTEPDALESDDIPY